MKCRTDGLQGGVLALCAAVSIACGSESPPDETQPKAPATRTEPAKPAEPAAKQPAADPAQVARAEAQQLFSLRCATCHGPGGAGDGPGAAALDAPPRDFRNPEWQASVSDEHIEKIIQYGGAAVKLSAFMPPNPDLVSRPELVRALREHVRSLAKAP